MEHGPLLMYQDDSSDDLENVIDDLLVPGSDSGDDWKDVISQVRFGIIAGGSGLSRSSHLRILFIYMFYVTVTVQIVIFLP